MKEMSWPDFDKRRKETNLVIIPTGACEEYGPHLPLGTDTIVSEEIALKLAPRVDALIAPTISMGESFGLGEFPGTIVIKTESFRDYIEDVFISLKRWEMKRFFFLNMHAGNVPIISRICREYRQDHDDIKCAQVDWWRFIQSHCEGILQHKGYMAHGHASECGTSIMLYLRPDLVDVTRITKSEPKDVALYTGYQDIIKYKPFSMYTDSGSVGDSTVATREKGEALVTKCVDRLVEFIQNAF
jgi:creatinine amidohydrolase